MKAYWLSWWVNGAFTWEGPWWISATRKVDGYHQNAVCAAVMARDLEHAEGLVREAHEPRVLEGEIDWRFLLAYIHGQKAGSR